MTWRVAVGSGDDYMIDQHFGRCDRFLIYELEADGMFCCTEDRNCEWHSTAQGGHEESSLQAKAQLLSDCSIVLVCQIGPGAKALLHENGIVAMAVRAPVEQALRRLNQFLRSGRESILQ
ncbi:NifB/NifX family molybdenum-iron cluster-binding protein [Paenibacillus pedocola]|uniref:NifB/NifX family molybdenum-iron cluster-binding protein n=1 Tax=Paenibacillus pedocola TaxID=3242193 RepID=UPI0028773D40|nr:NifB/NifX family molybdenum-iron cluster-binding protein [Paenibacillus typhae]